jgi:hypothetical protein
MDTDDTTREQAYREIIRGLSFISLMLLLIVLLLGAIVFGFAEVSVTPV